MQTNERRPIVHVIHKAGATANITPRMTHMKEWQDLSRAVWGM